MLTHIRFFLILYLMLTGLGGTSLGMYFHKQATMEVQDLGEKANLAVARNFAEDIWPADHDPLQRGTVSLTLQADLKRFLHDTGLAGLRIYNADGVLEYTTGGTMRGADFSQALKDPRRVTSSIVNSAAAGMEGSLVMVRSFIPIGVPTSALFVECFTDVTNDWQAMRKLELLVGGSVTGLLLVLLMGMLLVYRKTEIIIAGQHEKNMELEAQAASAQEATNQKSQFLAGISHELRTPLNAIIGFSEIIRSEMMDEVKNPKFASFIGDIHSSGVHLLSLINDILDYSKAEAGKLELEIEEINVTKQTANSLRLVLPRAESGGVDLVNNLPKEHFVIETDGKKFKQIMLNLLSNAVKFTPSGGQVTISGWRDLSADALVFQVADTGIGIAQKDIAKAMAPFGQVDSALSRKYEGTGLGLPLTHKFIELMGGRFSIQSEQGKGTTVTFSLPRTFRAVDGVVIRKTL